MTTDQLTPLSTHLPRGRSVRRTWASRTAYHLGRGPGDTTSARHLFQPLDRRRSGKQPRWENPTGQTPRKGSANTSRSRAFDHTRIMRLRMAKIGWRRMKWMFPTASHAAPQTKTCKTSGPLNSANVTMQCSPSMACTQHGRVSDNGADAPKGHPGHSFSSRRIRTGTIAVSKARRHTAHLANKRHHLGASFFFQTSYYSLFVC